MFYTGINDIGLVLRIVKYWNDRWKDLSVYVRKLLNDFYLLSYAEELPYFTGKFCGSRAF